MAWCRIDSRLAHRVINNCEKDGGQTVMHLYFHLIGRPKTRIAWRKIDSRSAYRVVNNCE